MQAKARAWAREAAPMKTAAKPAKKRATRRPPSVKVEKVHINELTLEIPEEMPYDPNDPIAVLSPAERRFVQARVMGSTAHEAMRLAFPHWSEKSLSHAWKWSHRSDIAKAIHYIQTGFSKRFTDALILSKEQRLVLLSQAAMTPLSEIDADSIFCTEHKITVNANGETHSYKKEAMSTLIKAMGDVEGNGLTNIEAMGIGALLGMMRRPGLPIGESTEADLEDAA